MTGSHLDTQPTGGKFDGAYGVIAGLELVRTLNDLGYETEAPIEVVAWTNEEGSRFSPAMVGSGVFAGVFDLAEGLARPDNLTGVTLGAELDRIGFAGPEPAGGRPVAGYFEAHIEQGPILEAAGLPIGVVTGAQGQRGYEVTVTGQETHAGPTPMPRRRNALVGGARMIDAVNRIGHAHAPYACATVGFVQVGPSSIGGIVVSAMPLLLRRQTRVSLLCPRQRWSCRIFVVAETQITDRLALRASGELWCAFP